MTTDATRAAPTPGPTALETARHLLTTRADLLAALQLMLLSLEKDGPASAIAVLNTHGRAAVDKAEGRS